MSSSPDLLLSPLKVGAWSLPNRVVMAPMTRSRADEQGAATALHAEYYAQRASAGLIIAEASQISPSAQGYLRTPGIHTRAQVDGWRRVTDAVHQRGGTIVLQLWHVGRVSHPANRLPGTLSVAPSAIAPGVRVFAAAGLIEAPVPHALTLDEIAGVVRDYADAARRARDAGFDGVELHGANGYLIDQFLQDGANHRSDAYGGPVANRCRLLFEVCDALADAIGADRVGVRLSPFGVFNGASDSDPQSLFDAAIRGLAGRGLAYLHVINLEASGDRTAKQPAAVDVPAFTRQRYPGTLIAAGGYSALQAEAVLAARQADLVAFGRPYIANPDLVQRFARGLPLAEPDRATFYTEGAKGYTDYPVAA